MMNKHTVSNLLAMEQTKQNRISQPLAQETFKRLLDSPLGNCSNGKLTHNF